MVGAERTRRDRRESLEANGDGGAVSSVRVKRGERGVPETNMKTRIGLYNALVGRCQHASVTQRNANQYVKRR